MAFSKSAWPVMPIMMKLLWNLVFFAVLIWSGINPKDMVTWLLEVSPAIIGFVVLAMTWNSFRLTPMLYALILLHCVVLMIGGHYTYAEVPLFDWIKPVLGFERNNYDKLGHLMQGFVPALIAREILLRKNVFSAAPGSAALWRNFFIVCFCLALSAFYELIEWFVALLSEEAADAFLGTQGFIWDTQTDMAYALLGSVLALVMLARWHDAQLDQLPKR